MSSQKSSKKVTKKKSTIKKGGGGKSISSKKSEKNLSKKLKKLSKKSTAPKSESSQSSTKLDDSKTIAKSCTNVSTDDTLKKTAKSDSIKKSNNVDADLAKQQDAMVKANTTQPLLSTPNNGIPLDVNEKCLFNTCKLDPDIALKVSKNRQAIEQVIQLLRDIPPDQITGDIKEDLIRIHLIARGIRIRLAHHLAEQERKMMDTMMKMLTPPPVLPSPASVKKESEGQNTTAKTNEMNDNSKFKTGKFDDSSISAAATPTDINKSMKSDQQQSTTTTDNTLGKMIENEIVKIIAEPLAKVVEDNDENCKIIIKAVVKEEVTAAAATVKTDDADTSEAKNGDDNASSNSSQNQTTNEDD